MTASISVTLSDPLGADKTAFDGIVAAIGGSAVAGTPADSFPADPTLAPTSPENSELLLIGGKIAGPAYLKDTAGSVHTLAVRADGVTTDYAVNGEIHAPFGVVNACLVRQGAVFVTLAGGQIQQFNGGMGAFYPAALPAPFVAGAPGVVPVAALPALPIPSSIAPGSSGKVILCGIGQALATLSAGIAAAGPGDTVKLQPGVYTDTPPAWTVPLVIDLGTATFNATGQTGSLANGKGLLVPCADSVIQGGTIVGVAMDQPFGQLTSAIRPDAGCGFLTLKNVKMHGNQCGVGHGSFPCVIVLDSCDISANGLRSNSGSLTHNLYVGAECPRLTLINVVSTAPVEGHAIKYRGPALVVSGGRYASAVGKPFDLPNGSTVPFVIVGATIQKGANDPDHGILAYGEEGPTNGLAGGWITGGSIAALCQNPTITGAGGTIVVASALTGNRITNGGASVVLLGV